jgi:hypothetical protein
MACGSEYHKTRYFCFRHWLEALRLGEFVPMLARRLLFTRTNTAGAAILPQMLSDFAEECRPGPIRESGQRKFASIIPITLLSPARQDDLPEIHEAIFPLQAPCGGRGAPGVSSCSHHAEGLHRKLNATAARHRRLLSLLGEVLPLS